MTDGYLGGAIRGKTRPEALSTGSPKATLALLDQVRGILDEYADYLPLTVRQVFYRLVGVHGYDKTEQAARLRGIRVLHASPSSLRAGLRLFSATARDRGPKPQAAQPPARRGSTRTRAPEVGHGDFPQHLDDLLAAILIELGAKDAGEPVKIDGAVAADYRLANEPARFIVANPEMRLQQSVELAALFVGNLAVDCQGVDEQRCCGQPQFLLAHMRSRVSEALEKLRECRCHLAFRQLPLRFGEPLIAQVDAYRDL